METAFWVNTRHSAVDGYCYFIGSRADHQAVTEYLHGLALELAARGHRVILLLESRRVAVTEEPASNPAVLVFPSRWPTRPQDVRFLYRLIRQHRPDCLIGNFGTANLMTTLGWLMRVPQRVAWHRTMSTAVYGDATSRSKARWRETRRKIVYKLATRVIANSQAASQDVQRVYGVPPHKCHVFYDSLADPLPTLPAHQPGNQPLIVCVARLAPMKGQDTLIRAIALLTDDLPEVRAEFVGDGPQRSNYERLAQQLGVADRCTFVGHVPHDEVLARMAAATVCVMPTRSEAFGLVNIEAMAVGTPVVASQVGGIPEIIRDGQDGFLVPPDDPQALADRLRLLLTDPALRARMSQSARQRFLDCFEQRANIARQADWFEALVADSKR